MTQRTIWEGVYRVVRFVVVAYLAVLLMLLWLETSLVYPAPVYPIGDWNVAKSHGWEEVNFTSADGTKLHGWYRDLAAQGKEPQAYMLYCHGNGENVGFLGEYLAELADEQQLNIFMLDYRGYGRSEGSPHETDILADGDAFCKRKRPSADAYQDFDVVLSRSQPRCNISISKHAQQMRCVSTGEQHTAISQHPLNTSAPPIRSTFTPLQP